MDGDESEMRVDPGPDESLGDMLARLARSGRDYAQAELGRQRLRAEIIGAGVRDIAILVGLAAILAFGALVALLVGLVIALSPLLTPLGATGAVVIGALALVVLLLLLARGRLRRIMGRKRP